MYPYIQYHPYMPQNFDAYNQQAYPYVQQPYDSYMTQEQLDSERQYCGAAFEHRAYTYTFR
jgi:hypothetical protein